MYFIDTNVFIRYMTRDDPQKAEACRLLFERAKQNKVELYTSDAVIAEIVFVLSSKRLYNLSPQQIQERLQPMLSLPALKMQNKRTTQRALVLYAQNQLDFEDALSIAEMERRQIAEIYSYDTDFDSIVGSDIHRIEP
ncbi:MAG: PIN domain-containing protein [Caldilineaceae bacterium]